MDWLPWSSKKYDNAIREALPFDVSDDELKSLSADQKKTFLEKYKPNKFRDPLSKTVVPEVEEPRFGRKIDFSGYRPFYRASDSALLSAGIDPVEAKHWVHGVNGINPVSISNMGVSKKLPLTVDSVGKMPIKFKDAPPRIHGPELIKVLDKHLGYGRHLYDGGTLHDLAGSLVSSDVAVDDFLKTQKKNWPAGQKAMLFDLVDALKKEDDVFNTEMKDVMRRNGMQSLADMRAAGQALGSAADASPGGPLGSARILDAIKGKGTESLGVLGNSGATKGGIKGGISAVGKGIKNLFSKNKKLAPVGAVAEALTKGASLSDVSTWRYAAIKANAMLQQ